MGPLERETELADLAHAVEATIAGRGGVVLLEGPAGIGKSALLDEARRRAAGRLTMFGARGSLLERDFGFGVVRQLLEAATRRQDLPEAVATVFADAPATLGPDSLFATLNGLYWAIVDLASERPLLLAVDDLQWADRSSLRVMAYLARRIEELPVLLLATVRSGEPHVDEDLLAAVRQLPARTLTLAPLSAAGVGAIVSGRLGAAADPAFVDACHAATGGNPLLVRELAVGLAADGVDPLRAGADTVRAIGPRAVARTVQARLAPLEPDALAVARAVAVLGHDITVADAAGFAGLTRERVAQVTGPLARAEILRAEPPLAFVHPLVADAVLLTLSPGERELRHAEAARMLRDRGAPAEQVAGHLLRAPADGQGWVVETLRDAAAKALSRGAADSAAAFLNRALAEPPPADQRAAMLLETGLVEAMGSGPRAVEHLRGALAALVDPPSRAVAAGALSRTLLLVGDPVGGSAVAEAVAAELSGTHADERDQLLAFAAMTRWFDDRAAGMTKDLPPPSELTVAPDAGAGPRMLAGLAAFAAANVNAPRAECVRLARAALADGWLLDADAGLIDIPPVVVLMYADDERGHEYLVDGLAEVRRRGSMYGVAGMQLWLTWTHVLRGELQDAEASALEANEVLAVWRNDEGPDYAAAFEAYLRVERGDLAGARAVLDARAVARMANEGSRHWHEARLALHLAGREDAAALEEIALLSTRYAHVANPATSRWRAARGVVRARAGDREGAAADFDAQLGLAREWGAPGPIGRVLRLRGESFGDEGDLRAAVEVLAGSTMRLEHARALAALGRHLRLERRPTDAREPLREALALASSCGADGLAAEVRAELGAAGARPRTVALRGSDALTPAERRVAVMAAGGRTNRDIAEELYVTPKTVEVHLSAAYRKLGIASRRGLEAALA